MTSELSVSHCLGTGCGIIHMRKAIPDEIGQTRCRATPALKPRWGCLCRKGGMSSELVRNL